MDDDSILSLLVIIILLFLAAFFALAETAFASVSRSRIKSSAEKGDARAKKALAILDDFDRAITTLLIGTNIVHMVTAAIVTVFVTKRWGVSAVAISTVITTVAVFFAGEMLPKSIGKKYSERFSKSLAGPLRFFMKLFYPVSVVLTAIGRLAARLAKGDGETTVTEDELYDIIENMKDEGELDEEQSSLVHSALSFGDVTVESVLTARVDVAAIDIEDTPEEILSFIKTQNHSRFPVYRDSIDNIIGVLQIRKFIKAYMHCGGDVKTQELLDEVCFTHQSSYIDELLPEMSRKKLNMAIVTDNYGGTLGIVTVEDILEELVGEIWDEDDEVFESCVKNSDGSYTFDASVDIEDAFEFMDYKDPDEFDFEHKLLGEWAYEHFELLPHEGDSFQYNGLRIIVSKMKQRRIISLRIEPQNAPSEEGGEAQ